MIDGDVEKRTVWAKVLQSRGEMGYPYIFLLCLITFNPSNCDCNSFIQKG